MPGFLYTYLRVLAAFGIFAIPIVALQIFSLLRLIMLIREQYRRKAENRKDAKVTVLFVCYCILTVLMWFPFFMVLIKDVMISLTR